GGMVVTPTASIKQIRHTDLVIIPGLWGSPLKTLRKSETLISWLQSCHLNGSKLCSIVSGSYFLAEAGLLDGHTATTHWYYFDDFHRRYPRVKLDRKRFITLDNDLYCTGSVNAARDVMLHLVEQLFDETIANEVAKHFTHEIKRSYESRLLGYLQHDTHHDEQIIKVQEWLQDNYQQGIQFDNVAEQFKMSVRSLNRRFKTAANLTPLQYLQEIRIEHAKELLKQSNLAIAEVSYAVGYQDSSYFGSLFKKTASVTPAEYRSLVRSKVFKVEE
ncbi:MAG: helix-turn-helix domain-containing protein, partial [Gammaproteobacteria bacterium]|nr:helix-turn-helix domain-containing protein [Gammaproteobacteria bacterium]